MRNATHMRLYEIRMREMHLDMVKVVFSSLLFALQDTLRNSRRASPSRSWNFSLFFLLTRRLCSRAEPHRCNARASWGGQLLTDSPCLFLSALPCQGVLGSFRKEACILLRIYLLQTDRMVIITRLISFLDVDWLIYSGGKQLKAKLLPSVVRLIPSYLIMTWIKSVTTWITF